MPLRVLVILLLVFMQQCTPDSCVYRDHITVLEGEPYHLKCCLPYDHHHHHRNSSIRWTKRYGSNRTMTLHSNGRIIFNDDAIEFWPIEMIDKGIYSCAVGNKESHWNITVTKRSEHGCFHPKYLITKEVEVGKSLIINCTHDLYQTEAYEISLFKDCSPIPGNHKANIRKNAVLNDAGNYTCIFFLYKNKRSFNVTKTFNVKIKDNTDTMPTLYGNSINYVEAELGKEKTLNCTALLRDPTAIIYWNDEHDNDTNIHKEKFNRSGSNGELYVSSLLKINFVKEENLNVWYNCTLASPGILETIGFFLKKKEGPTDVSRHIFIIVLVSSAAVIFLVIMCVIYRVDIMLCYRDLIRRDETLTAIFDDIHSLIKKSRRLIIVLSENYMADKVSYELESGLHEALVERKIKIILIEFTPINDFTFLPQSLELLKSHRILKWKADKSLPYNSRFWKNLRYLMPAKTAK
ncbi:interleukin-18 receptor 1 isoform X2 [Macrotis lagotis]|uniref:interleukin-18 receptor 1 isoform X2 n=1 Tax=Macrotis lagotis TaxID=92651 RepID=UPI003D69AFB0